MFSPFPPGNSRILGYYWPEFKIIMPFIENLMHSKNTLLHVDSCNRFVEACKTYCFRGMHIHTGLYSLLHLHWCQLKCISEANKRTKSEQITKRTITPLSGTQVRDLCSQRVTSTFVPVHYVSLIPCQRVSLTAGKVQEQREQAFV